MFSGAQHSRWLFHGTTEIQKVARRGFANAAAQGYVLWGPGTYFARDASYSHRYAGERAPDGCYEARCMPPLDPQIPAPSFSTISAAAH